MKQKALRFGLVGCGAMGSIIARHVLKRGKAAQWTAFYDVDSDRAKALARQCKRRIAFLKPQEMLRQVDWVIEAASPVVAAELLKLCVRYRKNILIMSTAGLLDKAALLDKARKSGIRVLLPSGALAGLDAVKAARLGNIESVTISTVKPPKGLLGAPYLKEHGINVQTFTERTVVFEGSAREAAAGFPANMNVAATLTLACGLTPDQVHVAVIADPSASRNTHHIEIAGSSGTLRCAAENVPSPENPKTSALAVLSACAALEELFSGVKVGT